MFDEDTESILDRIQTLISLDAVACNLMSTACILIRDEESATELLRRIREHVSITEEPKLMYQANYYLDYIKDLLDILSAVEAGGQLPKIRDEVRDHYETLLYNRELLMKSLNYLHQEDQMDQRRNNYWMN